MPCCGKAGATLEQPCSLWQQEGTHPQLHSHKEGPCACLWPALLEELTCPGWSQVSPALSPHLTLGAVFPAQGLLFLFQTTGSQPFKPWNCLGAAAAAPLEPWSGSSTTDTLTKAKPTPQGQQFPKKANRLFPFTGCSQNLISQHDQSLHWNDFLSYSNKMNILANNTHKIHWTTQWKELQCMKK